MEKILITGGCGQLGTELGEELENIYGEDNVIISDLKHKENPDMGHFEPLDVLDREGLTLLVQKHKITQIYHLAAILSAKGELKPQLAWKVNIIGLLNVLNLALEKKINKVFWPSSIAAFGPDTPKENTPQDTIMNPNTVYGISKLTGERWCEYYFKWTGLDVRSLRYPGLISYKVPPGGGTTDYAVEIFHAALKGETYQCFLEKDTHLPMMYMPDAIQATMNLMHADKERITVRSSYNVGAMTFSPQEIYQLIQPHFPDFKINYQPDFRQEIADSWPESINDSQAAKDWGWKPGFDLERMTADILKHIKNTKIERVPSG